MSWWFCAGMALVVVAGCRPSSPEAGRADASAPAPLIRKGHVGELRLVPLTRLSAARRHDPADDCVAEAPRSNEARQAHAAGWSILGEDTLGPLRLVTVADGGEFLAGAGCQNRGTSVLAYREGRLVGVAYAAKDRLQHASRFGDALRLYDDLSPVAELQWDGHQLRLAALPPEDRACDGRARVPRLEGLRYAVARRRVLAAGWTPVPAPADFEDPLSEEARHGGFPEVHGCAGTGLGQCLNVFVDAAGHGLEVTTIEGPPSDANGDGRISDDETWPVIEADIRCEGPRPD